MRENLGGERLGWGDMRCAGATWGQLGIHRQGRGQQDTRGHGKAHERAREVWEVLGKRYDSPQHLVLVLTLWWS